MDFVDNAIMRIRAFGACTESMSEQEILDELKAIVNDLNMINKNEESKQIMQMIDAMEKRYRM